MACIKIIAGDITQVDADVIVNAANSSLLGGGGVDGAIHRAAGPDLVRECATLGGCETGQAKITKAYRLKAKAVIHTVGPIYFQHTKEEAKLLLQSCYRQSLELAKENKYKSIAFPLISAGVYGYPKKEALQVAIETIQEFGKTIAATIVLFDSEAYKIAREMFSSMC